MKKNKGMQLGAMLMALLIVGGMFVPSAIAKTDKGNPDLSDPTVVKALVEKLNKAGDKDKANELFAKLSPEEKEAVIEFLKVTQITVNTSMDQGDVSISSTCNSPRVVVSGLNIFGSKLWDYFQQIDRCYDGSSLTEVTRTKGGLVYGLFWQYEGHTGDTQSGGVGQSSYRAWTQGQFRLCVTELGCIEEDNPFIDMIVYGNGNSWYNYGGGIKTFP